VGGAVAQVFVYDGGGGFDGFELVGGFLDDVVVGGGRGWGNVLRSGGGDRPGEAGFGEEEDEGDEVEGGGDGC
jgi:hypothetical protein